MGILEFFGMLCCSTIMTRRQQELTAWKEDHPTFVA